VKIVHIRFSFRTEYVEAGVKQITIERNTQLPWKKPLGKFKSINEEILGWEMGHAYQEPTSQNTLLRKQLIYTERL
jgi:hypothetical protein